MSAVCGIARSDEDLIGSDSIGNVVRRRGTKDNELYMSDTGGVETIVFSAAISVDRDFDETRPGRTSCPSPRAPKTRACGTTDIRTPDVLQAPASINGMFVGKVIDGPLGVIGSWGVTGPSGGDDLAGCVRSGSHARSSRAFDPASATAAGFSGGAETPPLFGVPSMFGSLRVKVPWTA